MPARLPRQLRMAWICMAGCVFCCNQLRVAPKLTAPVRAQTLEDGAFCDTLLAKAQSNVPADMVERAVLACALAILARGQPDVVLLICMGRAHHCELICRQGRDSAGVRLVPLTSLQNGLIDHEDGGSIGPPACFLCQIPELESGQGSGLNDVDNLIEPAGLDFAIQVALLHDKSKNQHAMSRHPMLVSTSVGGLHLRSS
jgi:hypothetical protein